MYDFEKENDKEFLQEAGKLLQIRVFELERTVAQLSAKKAKDEQILQKLSEEL